MQHWIQVRAEAAIAGEFLLPSTRTGKPWSKLSHYQCARQVLEDAGLDSSEGGSFRLRHTFAIRQLRRGTDPVQVARWLAFATCAAALCCERDGCDPPRRADVAAAQAAANSVAPPA